MSPSIPSSKPVYDAVIVGAGPAGLMTAALLGRAGLTSLVLEAADARSHEYGRSDAFQCRCMEVMQSLGAPMEQLEHMGKKLYGRTFWEVGGSKPARRTAYARFYPEFLDFDKDYSLAVRQGLIEQVLIHDAEQHVPGFAVRWNWAFEGLLSDVNALAEVDKALDVAVRNTVTGEAQTVKARFLVAGDGARSSVRRWANPHFDTALHGESLPVTWCVVDVVGLQSNHPDLERLCIVRSEKGIVLVIPREPIEGKASCRFDIQLEKSKEETTSEDATRMIKDIFAPFTVEWESINWWSIYDVGQRIINKYSIDNRIFFVGDACHTHSPRAGLGLNTALLEAHNLAWKLSLVCKGLAQPEILSTYASERQPVAQELVAMDRKLVSLYAGLERHNGTEEASVWLDTLRDFQAANYAYQAGASIQYQPSALINSTKGHQVVIGKPGVVVGARARPAVVTRLSDSVPVPILPPYDGRFSIYLFVGNLSREGRLSALRALDSQLRASSTSLFSRFGYHNEETPDPLRFSHAAAPSSNGNGAHDYPAHEEKEACAVVTAVLPRGRQLYTYRYDDVPQITRAYHAKPHSLFRVAIVCPNSIHDRFVQSGLLPLINPGPGMPDNSDSNLLAPALAFCDDVPILSPYRQTAPEAGLALANPLHVKWGIDPAEGAIVVVRPDSHVALKTAAFSLEAWKDVEHYFDGFLLGN